MSLSDHPNLNRFDFPDGFVCGAATAAYQTEGTSFGGCGPDHWDTLAATPGNVVPTGLARIICSRTSPPPVRPNPGGHIRGRHIRGANVKDFFNRSPFDNYKWAEGYENSFGLVHVDFKTLTRPPKSSYQALAQND